MKRWMMVLALGCLFSSPAFAARTGKPMPTGVGAQRNVARLVAAAGGGLVVKKSIKSKNVTFSQVKAKTARFELPGVDKSNGDTITVFGIYHSTGTVTDLRQTTTFKKLGDLYFPF